MNDRQGQSWVSALLSDGRQDPNAAMLYLKRRLTYIAFLVSNLDSMKSSDARVAHFIGDRMVAITRQTVDTSSYQEMRSDFLPRAKEFVDVALAIADMNAFLWFTEKHCRLLDVF
jgi:hypothetical protein